MYLAVQHFYEVSVPQAYYFLKIFPFFFAYTYFSQDLCHGVVPTLLLQGNEHRRLPVDDPERGVHRLADSFCQTISHRLQTKPHDLQNQRFLVLDIFNFISERRYVKIPG